MKQWPILCVSFAAFAIGLAAGKSIWSGRTPTKVKVRFYQDSMHPWVRSDLPGICPICRMKLTPRVEGEVTTDSSAVLTSLSRNAVTVANVATETVVRGDLCQTLRVSGVFEALESRTAVVAVPAGGRLDFIAVDHPGQEIKQGATLARLFSPDLVQRSRYLRLAMSNQPAASSNLAKSAPGLIRPSSVTQGATNENGAPGSTGYRMELFMSDLVAPISGIITDRSATLGEYVMEGQKIATIIDPSVLWFRFEVRDRQLQWVHPGQNIDLHSASAPEKTWMGKVTLIEPVIEDRRGLTKVRAMVTNSLTRSELEWSPSLRPGMFAEGSIRVVLPDILTVPRSAIIQPGSTAWVYVERDSQRYERRLVRLGREGDDVCEVLSGLEEGERVVTTGNLLIDAQANLEYGDISPDSRAEEEGTQHEKISIEIARSTNSNVFPKPYMNAKAPSVSKGHISD